MTVTASQEPQAARLSHGGVARPVELLEEPVGCLHMDQLEHEPCHRQQHGAGLRNSRWKRDHYSFGWWKVRLRDGKGG